MAIANRLNELGILSPLEYKKSHGENYATGFHVGAVSKWSAVAVKRILTNEIYAGTMVQGKREKVNYKVNRFVEKPETEWAKVPGTHKAVISGDDYENVQRLLRVDTRASRGTNKAHLFSGLLFCGDCGEPMIRRVNRYKGMEKVYYICSTRNRSEGCSRHSIAEEELMEITFRLLHNQVALFLDIDRQYQHIRKMEVDFEEVAKFDREIERLRREQDKYLELRAGLYEDLKTKVITQSDFTNFSRIYEMQYEEKQAALEKQEGMIKKLFRNGLESGVKLERMKSTLQLTELDRDVLLTFVDKIEVCENRKIQMRFRNQEEFQKMLVLAEFASQKRMDSQDEAE